MATARMNQTHLYLASQSPRRLALLRQIGLTPIILPLRHEPPRGDVDETPMSGENAHEYVRRIALMKARSGLKALAGRQLSPYPILAADTTVAVDGELLGKPADELAAAAMLRRYSGRSHDVLTGVCIAFQDRLELAVSESQVHFKVLTEREIAAYVATGEAFGKAGGYGIQGHAAMFIEYLSGSYSGVMGLPLYETAELLKKLGIEPMG